VAASDEPPSFDLSVLKSRIHEIQSTHDNTLEAANNSNNIAVFGHDRNPYIATLQAQDSRLVRSGGGLWIGWPRTELESSLLSDAEISRQAAEFAKLIPDLSFMLSNRLCLPPDQR
jgi:hypothetical protein